MIRNRDEERCRVSDRNNERERNRDRNGQRHVKGVVGIEIGTRTKE